MFDPSNDPNWWIRFAGYGMFAFVGGIIGHLLRTMDADQPIRWSRAFAQGLGSGFTGILVLLLCQAMNLSEQWTGLVVGVCGWLGASVTMVLLEKSVLKRLGINKPTETENQE